MSAEFPAMHHSHVRDPPTGFCTVDVHNNVKDWVKGDKSYGRAPYVVNGLPVSDKVHGCCINEPCLCRSDVIFYNGVAYDQKPYIQGTLRTRPHDVMYLEGKLVPPFNPGKSIARFGYPKNDGKHPQCQCFNETKYGRPLHQCCTRSPYQPHGLGYSRQGLPYGETLGFFRFKPTKICDCREVPVQRLGECCTCEPGEYNPAQYTQDECPVRQGCLC